MNSPIIFIATAWGPRHGGINAFNADLCRALGKRLGESREVICVIAAKRDEAAEADALKSRVRLIATEKETLDSGGIALALRKAGIEEVAWWIGHDVTTGPATLEARELKGGGNVALIHHMSFRQYAGHKHQAGEVAVRREEEQRALFRQADRCFAVGPKLRDSLHELLEDAESPPSAHMLIPGLAQEIQPKSPAKTFRAMVFGRLDSDDDRIKQGRLAVAGVAAAVGQAATTPGSPPLLTGSRGIIDVIGIKDAGGETEQSLVELAERHSGNRSPLVTAQPFQEDRRQMFTQLAGAHLALMPSWHEGFGLVGWEAVAASVPLILSVDSGLYQLLREETPGLHGGNVYGVKVGGHTPTGDEDPNQENFTAADLNALKDAVLEIAANAVEWRERAAFLRRTLLEKGMTWDGAAKALLSGLGLNDPPPAAAAPPPNPSDPTPGAVNAAGDGLPADRRRQLPDGYFPNSLLLRAEYQVTPFQDFAVPALDDLLAWVTDEQASPYAAALRLYAADGGSGKTRLLIEACGRLRDRGAGDWTTRFIPDSQSPDKLGQAVEKLVKAHAKVFLAMDYAETRQKAVLAVTSAMLAAPAGHRVRLVLTARGQGEWWEVLPDNVKDERLRGFLRSEDVAQGPLSLPVPADDAATRLGIYQSAQAAFARLPLFQGKTPTPAPDLSGPLFARTLFIHLAALSALQGRRLENEKELLAAALDHERDYWRRTLGESAGDETALRRIEQAMALLTLADGAADPAIARAVIAAAPLLRDQPPAAQEALFNDLHAIYPRNGGVDALRPDLLGETLIHAALTNDERLLDAALDGENASVGAALTALTRLADRGKPQWLERALDQKRLKQGFVDQVMETALQLGPTLGDALAAAVDADIAEWLAKSSPRLFIPVKNRAADGGRHIVELPDDDLTAAAVDFLRPDVEISHMRRGRVDSRVVTAAFFPEEMEWLSQRGGRFFPVTQLEIFSDHPGEMIGEFQLEEWADTRASASLKGFNLRDVLQAVKAPEVWERTRGAGASVIVIDTGVSSAMKAIGAARQSDVDVCGEYSGNNWQDDVGHGSMCAAIAAGSRRDGGKYSGVAPEATVISARSNLRTDDLFDIYDEIHFRFLEKQISGPCVVLNCYGYHQCTSPDVGRIEPLLSKIRRMSADGIPFIFAAGNNHKTPSMHNPTDHEPRSIWGMNALECALTVGAVGKIDQRYTNIHGDIPHFASSRGPCQWDDRHLKPDIVAPCYGEVPWGDGFRRPAWWGTSGSAPLAAGLAALLLSVKPDLTPAALWDIMRDSAEPLNIHPYCAGKGMLNCQKAFATLHDRHL